jgi:hypothetical protein
MVDFILVKRKISTFNSLINIFNKLINIFIYTNFNKKINLPKHRTFTPLTILIVDFDQITYVKNQKRRKFIKVVM